MSMMCTKVACKAKSGPCKHEIMMMVMMLAVMVGGIGHFALKLF